jgi:hypothetical protein
MRCLGTCTVHGVERLIASAAASAQADTFGVRASTNASAERQRWYVACSPRPMPNAKRTNVKGQHEDFAAKNTMNPPGGGGGTQTLGGTGTQEQDPKRRFGQYGGAGEPPLMKK